MCLPIAERFAEAWALDQEPEMVEAGRREASRLGIANVRWRVGRAEMFDAPAAAFDLVTIGEAFTVSTDRTWRDSHSLGSNLNERSSR